MFNVGLSSRILLSDDAFPCAKERHWEVPTSALFQPSGMFYRGGRLHLVAGAAATVRTFQHGEGKGRGSWSGLSAACLLEHAALSSRDLSSSLTLSLCSRESGGRSFGVVQQTRPALSAMHRGPPWTDTESGVLFTSSDCLEAARSLGPLEIFV